MGVNEVASDLTPQPDCLLNRSLLNFTQLEFNNLETLLLNSSFITNQLEN